MTFDPTDADPALNERLDRACDRFEADWQAGRRPSIEEALEAAPPPLRGALLRELLRVELAYLEKLGDRVDRPAYRVRFAADLDRIGDLLDTERDDAAPTVDAPTVDAGPAAGLDATGPPSEGGRFRPIGPHAQGGLGEVLVALDAQLNRRVALKRIQPAYADDPGSRARFVLEAEVTGALEHPGIVPVYGLGVDPGGRPYYAMRFIQGDDLRQAIRRFHESADGPGARSLAFRALLRRFLDACNAVAYAHSRGVLHRDIKPANIMLGPYGETLVVDWGLAKLVGAGGTAAEGEALWPPSADDSGRTDAGSVIGTPAYMSPEQAAGRPGDLGPASDVYSLGATLYVLLAGKPAFEGPAHEVIPRVIAGDFPPPRRVNPRVPRALEAVCLKAMATRPEGRYADPRALADDLERWLADEPVSAYRDPLRVRLGRWLARHRTGVAAAVAAMLVGLVGLGVVAAVQSQGRAALAAKNAELEAANREVQARFDLAADAIRTFHTGVSEDFLLKQDQFHDLRDRLLRSAADFYGKLSARLGRGGDPASRRALLRANFELAELTGRVGRTEDALAAHRAVLAAREAPATGPGADPAARVELSRSLAAVGGLLEAAGKTDEALAAYARAGAAASGPGGGPPVDDASRAALAEARNRAGELLELVGRHADALPALEQARDLRAALAAADPADDGRRAALARAHHGLGSLLVKTARPAEALDAYHAARAIRERLARDDPAAARHRSELAGTCDNVGYALAAMGRPAEALAAYEEARAIQERLVRENPAVMGFRGDLAHSHFSIGVLMGQLGRLAEERRSYEAALALQARLARDDPAATRHRVDMAWTLASIGATLGGEGRTSEALAAYEEALEVQAGLARESPAVTRFRSDLARTHSDIGDLHGSAGRTSEALAAYGEALAIQGRLARESPAVTRFRSELAHTRDKIGTLLAEAGRPAEALRSYEEARGIRETLVRDEPGAPAHRDDMASCHTNLSVVLRRLGRPAEARDACDEAVAIREALIREVPEDPAYRSHMAWSHRRRGLARRDLGDVAGAAADARRAIALWDGLPGRNGEEWFETACARAALAGLGGRAGSGVSEAEAAAQAGEAMALLGKAAALGHRSPDAYYAEDALDPLRRRDDFRLLILDLAFPADPFAAPPG